MRGRIIILAGLFTALMLVAQPALAANVEVSPQDIQALAAAASQQSMQAQQIQNTEQQSAEETTKTKTKSKRTTIQIYDPEAVFSHRAPEDAPAPPSLEQLQGIKKENKAVDESVLKFDIRKDAIKEAAVSYGARGGLAWRTFYIRKELDERARYMDKVYNFRELLIAAPSGLLIEPPIVSESLNALLIQDGGQQAAVSDRLYNIVNNAKIVSAPRTWRTYLEREWGEIEPPPDILRPENDEERALWSELVAKGWQEGIDQANEIFQDDLNVLTADFQGMVNYRSLLAQGMISPPYALQVDRGVTGGGEEMRIGDRAVQITGVPELITGSEQWQPASR